MRRIYLDHNATTMVHPQVLEAMRPYFSEKYGNASSIHEFGRMARFGLEESREKIAQILKCAVEEIVFTSGGTESDNMAVKGTAWAKMEKGRHIITSAIEHPAILSSCEFLERHGFKVTYLKPDDKGIVAPDDLKRAIRKDTILVTIMHANNEIGTIQDIKALARVAHEFGIPFHTDAVQSTGKTPYTIEQLDIDMLSVSGHKIYGPKGVGLLFVKKRTDIQPLSHGGSHEHKRRAGTENVAGIVGLARAIEIAYGDMTAEIGRLRELTTSFMKQVSNRISDITILGDQQNRVANTVSIAFKAVEGESIVLGLDMKGVAVSSGSACSSGAVEPSHVIMALGVPPDIAQGAIRFSFGRASVPDDIDYVVDVLEHEVARLRSISPLYQAN